MLKKAWRELVVPLLAGHALLQGLGSVWRSCRQAELEAVLRSVVHSPWEPVCQPFWGRLLWAALLPLYSSCWEAMLYFCSYEIFIMLALGLFPVYEGDFKPGLKGLVMLFSHPCHYITCGFCMWTLCFIIQIFNENTKYTKAQGWPPWYLFSNICLV